MLWSVFILQAAVIVYFNLFHIKSHMGFDSSWLLLKTHLIRKEHTFFTGPWSEQSNSNIDTPVLLASFFYALTGKLYLSYGLANVVTLVPVVISFNSILKKLKLGTTSRLFAVNLLFSPYLMNGFTLINLGYAECFLWGPAYYNLRMLAILLIINEYINIRSTGKYGVISFVTLAFCIFSGLSCGVYMLIIFTLPCIIYIGLKTLIKNDIKELIRKEALYFYALSIAVLAGKEFGARVLGIEIIDSSKTWATLDKFFEVAHGPFLGILKLVGVLPVKGEVEVMSVNGISYIFPMFIFAGFVLSLIFAGRFLYGRKTEDKSYDTIAFLVTVVATNFASLSLVNVVYGSPVFEERYLISTLIIMMILFAFYLDRLDMKLLFSKALCIGLLASLFFNNILSDINYYVVQDDKMYHVEEIAAAVKSQDAELVYVYGEDLTTFERVLRMYDLDHVYKLVYENGTFFHVGDSLYYEENSDYSGPTLLIVSKENDEVPEEIMEHYTLVQEFDLVDMYRADVNPIVQKQLKAVAINGDRDGKQQKELYRFNKRLYDTCYSRYAYRVAGIASGNCEACRFWRLRSPDVLYPLRISEYVFGGQTL